MLIWFALGPRSFQRPVGSTPKPLFLRGCFENSTCLVLSGWVVKVSDAEWWLVGFLRCLAGKDGGQEEKRTTEDEMVGWRHRLNGHGFGHRDFSNSGT